MVYTGAPRQLPEILRLSDMYDRPGGADLEIKVLRDTGAGNIVDQYFERRRDPLKNQGFPPPLLLTCY